MDKELNYNLVTGLILEKLRRNHYRYTDRFPHISNLQKNGQMLDYMPCDNDLWTSSFFPGEMMLSYRLTGDTAYLEDADKYLDSFDQRLTKHIGISHDLGFLYTLTCVALYRLAGNQRAKEIADRAADELYLRYNEKGRFIQAWGEMNRGDPYVKIIADTMLNLPLLYSSKLARYMDAAKEHAYTSARYLVRSDYSSFHTYLMDPETGKAVEGRTHQGFRDSSTWARGQAWIVYGYALSYSYTKESSFLEVSRRAADYFLERLPKDKVSYWDMTFTDEIPDIKDTSAAAILACGLLELSEHLPSAVEKEHYTNAAKEIVKSLYENYFYPDMNSPVLLTDGMYHRDNGSTGTIWGDYFFFEALCRLNGNYERFW